MKFPQMINYAIVKKRGVRDIKVTPSKECFLQQWLLVMHLPWKNKPNQKKNLGK